MVVVATSVAAAVRAVTKQQHLLRLFLELLTRSLSAVAVLAVVMESGVHLAVTPYFHLLHLLVAAGVVATLLAARKMVLLVVLAVAVVVVTLELILAVRLRQQVKETLVATVIAKRTIISAVEVVAVTVPLVRTLRVKPQVQVA